MCSLQLSLQVFFASMAGFQLNSPSLESSGLLVRAPYTIDLHATNA